MQALFRTQPQTYAARLLSSRSARNTWEKSASLLQQREDDLKLIRVSLFGLVISATQIVIFSMV